MPPATPHKGVGPFPAFRLTNGVINASDCELGHSFESCERWAEGSALAVIAGLVLEVGIAFSHPPFNSFWEHWGAVVADTLVALGVAGEVLFGRMGRTRQNELTRRSDKKLTEAIDRATELENKLRPRAINQEQWDLIQTLRGQYTAINVAYETDAETWWFANDISRALYVAGITVGIFSRSADVHSFGSLIFEPNGFDGSNPRTSKALYEVFIESKLIGALAFITKLPEDIQAPSDIPMIIVGGRFILPPAWHPSARAAGDNNKPAA